MYTSKVLMLAICSFASSGYASVLCKANETVSFSCGFQSKSVSVCVKEDKTLVYRFGAPQKIELELNSAINFSRTGYSGGGEGHLTFTNGQYKYVIYSSISNGDWLDDGTRKKIIQAGIYVLKHDKLLNNIQCQRFSGKSFIHDLPKYTEKEFIYY